MRLLKALAIRISILGLSLLPLGACVVEAGHVRPWHWH